MGPKGKPVYALEGASEGATSSSLLCDGADSALSCCRRECYQMAARFYEDDKKRRRDQHACALGALHFRCLLRDCLLWSAGAILGPRRDGPPSRPDVLHHTGTRRTRDARGKRVPDARGDREHEARLQV